MGALDKTDPEIAALIHEEERFQMESLRLIPSENYTSAAVLEAAGPRRFFQALAELGDAAFIDTRVLLAHFQIDAARSDRFLSDLGRWRAISEPFLRDFTRAAVEAPLTALLGGHSLVSGGLMALNEFAWREREEG